MRNPDLLLLLLALLACGCIHVDAKKNGKRPNILLLLTDDQDAVMGVRGSATARRSSNVHMSSSPELYFKCDRRIARWGIGPLELRLNAATHHPLAALTCLPGRRPPAATRPQRRCCPDPHAACLLACLPPCCCRVTGTCPSCASTWPTRASTSRVTLVGGALGGVGRVADAGHQTLNEGRRGDCARLMLSTVHLYVLLTVREWDRSTACHRECPVLCLHHSMW